MASLSTRYQSSFQWQLSTTEPDASSRRHKQWLENVNGTPLVWRWSSLGLLVKELCSDMLHRAVETEWKSISDIVEGSSLYLKIDCLSTTDALVFWVWFSHLWFIISEICDLTLSLLIETKKRSNWLNLFYLNLLLISAQGVPVILKQRYYQFIWLDELFIPMQHKYPSSLTALDELYNRWKR